MSEVTKPKSVFQQLADGQKPGAAAEATPETTNAAEALTSNLDNNLLGQLVALMVLEQKQRLQGAQEQERRDKARSSQRERNAKDQDNKLLLKQARCKHLKGGKKGPKTQNKDYAVYQHRFISFIEYIRCAICGMKWFREDTAEYLVRKGRKIANHTKKGWREAAEMMEGSTNTMSASEAVPSAIQFGAAGQLPGYTDAVGLPTVPRIVDLEGKPVSDVEL